MPPKMLTGQKQEFVKKGLKAYRFHGVLFLPVREGYDEAVADCPLCGGENKLYVNTETGLYNCKRCQTGTEKGGGNVTVFLRRLYESLCNDAHDYTPLREQRKLLKDDTLAEWGLVYSPFTDNWLAPGYDGKGEIIQLYRYTKDLKTQKQFLCPTPDQGHGIHKPYDYSPEKEVVYLCEGLWDGAALYETLKMTKEEDGEGGYRPTSNEEESLLANGNVFALPSCNVFLDSWIKYFSGKIVYILFDNDHPKQHPKTGQLQPPVGWEAVKRVCQTLSYSDEPPAEIHVLMWGEEGYTKNLPSGFDIRDALSQAESLTDRCLRLANLLQLCKPMPAEWMGERTEQAKKEGKIEIPPIECNSWEEVVNDWKKAMKWTEGLDRALSVEFACVISTETIGEPIWIKIMGPPSCGKTTIAEGLAISKKYVKALSTFRGFHSGYKTDKDGDQDYGLIPQIQGKTLVIKDADTLMKSPNYLQILSEARDIFDGSSRSHYRQGVQRNYEDIKMTFLLNGTSALKEMDRTELGARFLDCVIMYGVDRELEREINKRVVKRAFRNVGTLANGKPETRHDPAMIRAKQRTGGYVEYLRDNAERLLAEVQIDEEREEDLMNMGEFVALMRARPSEKQKEVVEREFSARLVEQISRLTACLAAVLGRPIVDDEVMRRVRRVALDTARGRALNIVKYLYNQGEDGAELKAICVVTHETEDKERPLLLFLQKIGVVEQYVKQVARGILSKKRWRLTERSRELYSSVVGEKDLPE